MSAQTVEWGELTEKEKAAVLKRREKKAAKEAAKAGESRGVHVVWLVDRSGSMQAIQGDVVGGFNNFVADQRKIAAPCRLTLHQFDSMGFDTLYDAVPLEDVREMTLNDFTPRSMTPLLDSVGRTITSTQVSAEANRGQEDVVVVIFTDGYENASREYTREQVQQLVKAKEADGWTFLFMGAGIDAYAMGGAIGVSANNTQAVIADSVGTQATYRSVSSAVGAHRSRAFAGGQSLNTSYFEPVGGKAAEEDLKRRKPPAKR